MRTIQDARVITTGDAARKLLLEGALIAGEVVGATLGPKGRTIIIENVFDEPHITKDGVTVINQIKMDNAVQNLGAFTIRDAARRTHERAGDGTTTCSVLASEMIKLAFNGMKDNRGMLEKILASRTEMNPVEIQRGMELACKDIVNQISKLKRNIDPDSSCLHDIAVISANGDTEIGDIVSKAVSVSGAYGEVTVNETSEGKTSVEILQGYSMNRGYTHIMFVNTPKDVSATYEDVVVVIVNDTLRHVAQMRKMFQVLENNTKPVIIIADDFVGEAEATLYANRMGRKMPIVLVKSPSFGPYRKSFLEDLATYCGATVIGEDQGIKLEKIEEKHLGVCDKIIVRQDRSVFLNEKNTEAVENCKAKIKELLAMKESDTITEADRDIVKQRISALQGNVVAIKVYAPSDTQLKEVKDRLDDSLRACKAALEEGIVPGGGSALLHIVKDMEAPYGTPSFVLGYNVVLKACIAPIRRILENAGIDSEMVINSLFTMSDTEGYSVLTREYTHMIGAGIIDPAKVVRCALENAVSAAGTLITTEGSISFAHNLNVPVR